jgi:hypothetical protein
MGSELVMVWKELNVAYTITEFEWNESKAKKKKINLYSWSLSQDSNRKPPEYEAG